MNGAILCSNLVKRYDGRPPVEAVRGVDLAVEVGECFGLLGPNGAGKTTTMEILEGLLDATSGQVEILGHHWGRDDAAIRQLIGISLQETQLSEKLSVRETVALFRSFYPSGLTPEEAIARVSLEDKSNAWIKTLSGGQKQRLAVALAIVGDPQILFLDEPTTGLDPQSRRQLWEIIHAFRKSGRTIMITTHYMDEAERLCDRVAVVDHGKVIALGSPKELISQLGGEHVVDFAISGGAPIADEELRQIASVNAVRTDTGTFSLSVIEPHLAIPSLLSLLKGRGSELSTLTTRHATLEDVFVSLTGRHLQETGEEEKEKVNALLQITASRIREFYREPAAIFWVYGFPLLMALALGIAFRQRPTEQPIAVDLIGQGSEWMQKKLADDKRFKLTLSPKEDWKKRLRAGKTDLVIEVEPPVGYNYTLWDEPHRAESLLARYAVELALRGLPRPKAEQYSPTFALKHLEEKGTRYIDYLMPGMLGMNLMGGGLWGVGFALADLRTRKLLKRFLATPMRRSDFLFGVMLSRLIFTVPEVLILLGFAWLVFGVTCQGNLLLLLVVITLGGVSFAGIGLLVASRAKTVETVSGLMNLVMLPMWILSGVFFSYERFPEAAHPIIRLLPLTALNDALRGVMLDGQSAWQLWPELTILAAWGGVTFVIALRIFRWR